MHQNSSLPDSSLLDSSLTNGRVLRGHAMQGTMPREAQGTTWPSLPSNGRDHQTHEKGTPPGSPIVTHIAATREMHQAGQVASYSVTKGISQVRHAGCVTTPTGRLRKGKPAKAASRTSVRPGSTGGSAGKSCVAALSSQQASGVWQHFQHGSRLPFRGVSHGNGRHDNKRTEVCVGSVVDEAARVPRRAPLQGILLITPEARPTAV